MPPHLICFQHEGVLLLWRDLLPDSLLVPHRLLGHLAAVAKAQVQTETFSASLCSRFLLRVRLFSYGRHLKPRGSTCPGTACRPCFISKDPKRRSFIVGEAHTVHADARPAAQSPRTSPLSPWLLCHRVVDWTWHGQQNLRFWTGNLKPLSSY